MERTSIDGLPAFDPTLLPRRRSQPECLVLNGRVSHESRRLTDEPVGRAPDCAASSARLVPEQILGPWGLTFRAPDGTSSGQ